MTNHELIILALEQLRDGSYSPDRRERCQGLIEEMKMADQKFKACFSVHDYDADGDLMEEGIFLHFDGVRIKVAESLSEFKDFSARVNGMIEEIEEGYPEVRGD